MGKRIRHELRYDGATAEQVHAMLADPAFREEVCEYQRYPRRTVAIVPAGAGMTVRVDQHRPADEVPSFARKIVGDEINILQEEDWSSPLEGRLTVTIPGKPGEMKGTAVLLEKDGVTTETVTLDITVKIPLVAGKVEELLAKLLGSALRAEERTGKAWLAR